MVWLVSLLGYLSSSDSSVSCETKMRKGKEGKERKESGEDGKGRCGHGKIEREIVSKTGRKTDCERRKDGGKETEEKEV